MTFEKSRSTWNSGFRGYKDNSPIAVDRRRQHEAEQHAYFKLKQMGFVAAIGGVIVTEPGSELSKMLSKSAHHKRVIR